MLAVDQASMAVANPVGSTFKIVKPDPHVYRERFDRSPDVYVLCQNAMPIPIHPSVKRRGRHTRSGCIHLPNRAVFMVHPCRVGR